MLKLENLDALKLYESTEAYHGTWLHLPSRTSAPPEVIITKQLKYHKRNFCYDWYSILKQDEIKSMNHVCVLCT